MTPEDRLNIAHGCPLGLTQVPVKIRPITPADAPNLQAYIRRLSRETRHNRFLGALNELSPRELERLSHARQRGTNVLVAEVHIDGNLQMVGEAPYAVLDGAVTYEFAISVADEWQRRGIGTRMVQLVEQQVLNLGARYLVADALHSNQAVRALARKAGFIIRHNSNDARLVRLFKCINHQAPAHCSRQQSILAAERWAIASGAF